MINANNVDRLSQPVRQLMKETFKVYLEDLERTAYCSRNEKIQQRVGNMLYTLERKNIWMPQTPDTITTDLEQLLKVL